MVTQEIQRIERGLIRLDNQGKSYVCNWDNYQFLKQFV